MSETTQNEAVRTIIHLDCVLLNLKKAEQSAAGTKDKSLVEKVSKISKEVEACNQEILEKLNPQKV